MSIRLVVLVCVNPNRSPDFVIMSPNLWWRNDEVRRFKILFINQL